MFVLCAENLDEEERCHLHPGITKDWLPQYKDGNHIYLYFSICVQIEGPAFNISYLFLYARVYQIRGRKM